MCQEKCGNKKETFNHNLRELSKCKTESVIVVPVNQGIFQSISKNLFSHLAFTPCSSVPIYFVFSRSLLCALGYPLFLFKALKSTIFKEVQADDYL